MMKITDLQREITTVADIPAGTGRGPRVHDRFYELGSEAGLAETRKLLTPEHA